MQYGIIGWIVVGLIAGILAKVVIPGKDPGGIIITILIGIAGGLLGGFAASRLGIGGGNFMNILIATLELPRRNAGLTRQCSLAIDSPSSLARCFTDSSLRVSALAIAFSAMPFLASV